MQPVTPARWRSACEAIGLTNTEREFGKLTRAWHSWGRHYHTLEHLAACLREFDQARKIAERPAEVELALWFHDAVYRTYRSDNELRSADWAARFLTERGAAAEAISRVRQLIMGTLHTADALEGDRALVVDVDLSILGQPESVYDQFERNVRREYWWVPKRRYVAARCNVLRSFIARSSIYHWPPFRQRYEAAARDNLQRAISALSPQ